MPFAALPSSPGFQQPAAPDWGRFAELAIQQIQHGGDIRAQAGKDFAEQLDKSFMQVSKIMEYNSPEAKAKRKMEMMKDQVMMDVYQDFHNHPDKYQMTAHGPILKDPYEQQMRALHIRQANQGIAINDYNINNRQKTGLQRDLHNAFRNEYGPNYDDSNLSVGPPQAGAQGSGTELTSDQSSQTSTSGDSSGDITPASVDTGGWHKSEDAQGKSYWYSDEGQYSDTKPGG